MILKLKVPTSNIEIMIKSAKVWTSELKTSEWWISKSVLDLLFFLISRLNNAYSPFVINL